MKKVISLMMVFAMSSAFATTYTWTGANGTDLADPENWISGGVVPQELTNEDTLEMSPQALETTFTLSKSMENAAGKLNLAWNATTTYFDFGDYEWNLLGGLSTPRDYGDGGTLATIAFTNGTFTTPGWSWFGTDWNRPAVELKITGSNTTFNIGGLDFRAGMGGRLTVTDGAKFYGSGDGSRVIGGSVNGLISGPGTVFSMIHNAYQHPNNAMLAFGANDSHLHITDGALVYIKSGNGTDKGLCINNGGNSGISLLVDGGATVTNLGILYIDGGINGSGSGHSMTVSNASIYTSWLWREWRDYLWRVQQYR